MEKLPFMIHGKAITDQTAESNVGAEHRLRITQVNDAFGVAYARLMAVAMLAALPVIIAYIIFQRRVTEAIMISSGVKG